VRWMQLKNTHACSICRGAVNLTEAYGCPLVRLSVVRHMRGLQWEGRREVVIPLDSGEVGKVVGSGPTADVRLPDPSLSRMHARVWFDAAENAFKLRDLGSSAGTYVRVAESLDLRPVVVDERRAAALSAEPADAEDRDPEDRDHGLPLGGLDGSGVPAARTVLKLGRTLLSIRAYRFGHADVADPDVSDDASSQEGEDDEDREKA
jgi:FHA domain